MLTQDHKESAAPAHGRPALSRLGAVWIAVGASAVVGAILVGTTWIRADHGRREPITAAGPSAVATQAAVPWSDRTDFEAWRPPPPPPREAAAPCVADDLGLARTESDGASGRTFLFVTLVKTTAGRCTLAGYPRLAGTTATGTRVTVPTEHDEYGEGGVGGQGRETPATIGQHETATLALTTGINCGQGPAGEPVPDVSFDDVALVLADGSVVPLARRLTTVCVPRVSRFYRDSSPPAEPASRFPGLRVALDLPGSVTPGEAVDYVVTLVNGTDRVVDLSPCPGYRQVVQVVGAGLAAGPVKGAWEYRLSCDAAPTLAPGEERRYLMRLVVPANAAGDEVLVSWGLVDNLLDEGAQAWVGLAVR